MYWIKFLTSLKNLVPKNLISQNENERITSIITNSKLHLSPKKKQKLISICIKEIIHLLSKAKICFKDLDFDKHTLFIEELYNIMIAMIIKINKIILNSHNEEQKKYFTLILTYIQKIQNELYNKISDQFLSQNDLNRYQILYQYYLSLNQNYTIA